MAMSFSRDDHGRIVVFSGAWGLRLQYGEGTTEYSRALDYQTANVLVFTAVRPRGQTAYQIRWPVLLNAQGVPMNGHAR